MWLKMFEKKMKKICRSVFTGVKVGLIGLAATKLLLFMLVEAPPKVLSYVNSYQLKWYPQYKNCAEFNADFREEKKKMGLEAISISALFSDENRAYAKQTEKGKYKIVIGDSNLYRKIVLMHELYHIFDMAKKGNYPKTELDYFLAEWRAQQYCDRRHWEETQGSFQKGIDKPQILN